MLTTDITVNLSLHTTETVFETLQTEWNDLLRRSPNDSVFSTLQWQSHWWAAYQAGALMVLTARDDQDRLIGIAPWFIETRADGERVVRGIGCVDVTDYVDVIIDAACYDQVLSRFAAYLYEYRAHYDRINLCNVPHHSPTLTHFPQLLEQHQFTVAIEQQEVCPVIELPEDWDGYMNLLDKKERHELRRKLRRTGGDEVEWYIVDDRHNLDEHLDSFLKLMAESAPYKAEFLQNEQNTTFFKRVMPAMYEQGWLQLAFLMINGEAAATYLNFDYKNHIQVYNSGLSKKHLNASPGVLLLAHLIRNAIDHHYHIFDFLRGNEEYKYRMGGKDHPVYMVKAQLSRE